MGDVAGPGILFSSQEKGKTLGRAPMPKSRRPGKKKGDGQRPSRRGEKQGPSAVKSPRSYTGGGREWGRNIPGLQQKKGEGFANGTAPGPKTAEWAVEGGTAKKSLPRETTFGEKNFKSVVSPRKEAPGPPHGG